MNRPVSLLASATAVSLLGGAALFAPTAAAGALPLTQADHPSGVVINEIHSQGGPFDWIELLNTSNTSVDLSSWSFTDDDLDRDYAVIADGTVLEPGDYLVLEEETDFDFGLGGGDAVNLFDDEGIAVDAHEYPSHAGAGLTWGRLPNGAGEFTLTAPTPGEANREAEEEEPVETVDSPIVINEVESNGDPVGDWVELANTDGENSVDISGWSILDDDDSHDPIVFPEGTSIESHGYFSIYTDTDDDGFGLGGNDSVRLFDADGELVDITTWDGHAATTWGRIPDMTGEFEVTGEPTRNMPNIPAGEQEPVNSQPWLWPVESIATADEPNTFDGDISGADFDENGLAYVVHNGDGHLYVLDFDEVGAANVLDSYQLRYPDGTGIPDAEGVTVGEDGAIFVATERNNDASSVSRPSVLRFELSEEAGELEELAATDEWNLAASTGELGANGGLEAIEWLPGQFGGSFAVGVEQTGELLFVSLDDAGEHELLEVYEAPFQGVMALDYQERTNELLVMCDEVCEGRSVLLTLGGESFTELENEDGVVLIDRPETLPNVANEGFASFVTEESCASAGVVRTVFQLWTDDNNTDGHSLRTATSVIEECEPAPTEPEPTEPEPTDPATTDPEPTDPSPTGPGQRDGQSGDGALPQTAAAPALWLLGLAALMLLAAAAVTGRRAQPQRAAR